MDTVNRYALFFLVSLYTKCTTSSNKICHIGAWQWSSGQRAWPSLVVIRVRIPSFRFYASLQVVAALDSKKGRLKMKQTLASAFIVIFLNFLIFLTLFTHQILHFNTSQIVFIGLLLSILKKQIVHLWRCNAQGSNLGLIL